MITATWPSLKFPMVMKLINTKGYQFVYQTFWVISQDGGANNPPALFLHIMKKTRVELKEKVE